MIKFISTYFMDKYPLLYTGTIFFHLMQIAHEFLPFGSTDVEIQSSSKAVVTLSISRGYIFSYLVLFLLYGFLDCAA